MKLIYPDYYPEFRCTAGACQHNCCREGWEIDIDEDSLAFYQSAAGEMGDRLRRVILLDETPHFALDEHECCPFLDDDGLCSIIKEYGEQALCQICTDHPRFRSFYSDRTEIGVGLCCEAACALILTRQNPMRLHCSADEEQLDEQEQLFLDARDRMLALAQERELSIDRRMQNILLESGAVLPQKSFAEWAEIYQRLDILDCTWRDDLRLIPLQNESALTIPNDSTWQTAAEQLLAYFLYRQLSGALDTGDFDIRAAFCVLSTKMVFALALAQSGESALTMEHLTDAARRYSSEVEYSEENVDFLLDFLYDEVYSSCE